MVAMQHEELRRTVQKLAENATKIKQSIIDGNLKESSKLIGDRVALVETLRQFRDACIAGRAKVSFASSDIKDELDSMVRNMKNNVSDAISVINARLLTLSHELAKVSGARKIVAYKIQGGRHGY